MFVWNYFDFEFILLARVGPLRCVNVKCEVLRKIPIFSTLTASSCYAKLLGYMQDNGCVYMRAINMAFHINVFLKLTFEHNKLKEPNVRSTASVQLTRFVQILTHIE